MNDPAAEDTAAIRAVVAALEVDGPASYCWLGQRYAVGAAVSHPDALVDALAERLYWDFHCPGIPAPSIPPPHDRGVFPSIPDREGDEGGRGSILAGWSVVSAVGDQVVVARDGLRIGARADELVASPAGIAPGAPVGVRVPGDEPGLPGGFRAVLGATGDPSRDPGARVDRHYWNLRPEGRDTLEEALVEPFDAAGTPFRLKTLNDPRVRRCDAAVLYTEAGDRAAVGVILASAPPSVAPHLRSGTPPFTRRRAPGLGFAEQPPGDESFGAQRCRLLARALAGPGARSPAPSSARVLAVLRAIAAAGLAPGRMHASPGRDPADDPPPLQ